MWNTNTRLKTLLLFLGCSLCWQACNVINPAEPVPTYIHIDSFHFVQNSAVLYQNYTNLVAPATHQTQVAYVYYNNSPVGIFDLPATFPVIANGTGQLEISAGIIANGQNNDVINYPFYTVDTFSFVAQPGHTINHIPQTEFFSDVKVTSISDFDESHTYFLPWQGTYVGFSTQEDSLSIDGHYGVLKLNAAASIDSAVDSSYPSFVIPAGQAFVEFDYYSTVPFYVGLQGNASIISTAPTYLSGIYPNTGWQKFYLEVDGFTSEVQGTSYNLYIKAVLSPGQTTGRLLIDNIQVVTF